MHAKYEKVKKEQDNRNKRTFGIPFNRDQARDGQNLSTRWPCLPTRRLLTTNKVSQAKQIKNKANITRIKITYFPQKINKNVYINEKICLINKFNKYFVVFILSNSTFNLFLRYNVHV